MTPKEKAEQLVKMYAKLIWNEKEFKFPLYRKCALIAVDEILELKETQEEYQIQYENGEWSRNIGYKYSKYWQEVKQEIEKI